MLTEPSNIDAMLPVASFATETRDDDTCDYGDDVAEQAAAVVAPVLTPAETDALFAQLFEQYEQPIFQYAYRLLGDPEDARDFTQDAFVKAYRKLPETLAKGNFQAQAWLYRIATNVCLDELRHRRLLADRDQGRSRLGP
ncbi:MAG: sigma-70 family RNA polymerase sigma factor [Chloroflexi bacterium]|nr:sigma-70 family RNA polymerase sigma factor [Chloroflexota bacterium]